MDPQHWFVTLNRSEEKQLAYIFILEQHIFLHKYEKQQHLEGSDWVGFFFEESGNTTTCFNFLTWHLCGEWRLESQSCIFFYQGKHTLISLLHLCTISLMDSTKSILWVCFLAPEFPITPFPSTQLFSWHLENNDLQRWLSFRRDERRKGKNCLKAEVKRELLFRDERFWVLYNPV